MHIYVDCAIAFIRENCVCHYMIALRTKHEGCGYAKIAKHCFNLRDHVIPNDLCKKSMR